MQQHHQTKNQFLMKTGIFRAIQQRHTQASVLKQNQQSTTQTKQSVVVQPRQMKDLARKIFNSILVKVLREKPSLAISQHSMVKSVAFYLKRIRGIRQKIGKAQQQREQIKVIGRQRSHGLPSFIFAVRFNVLHTCSLLSASFTRVQDHGSKTCLRLFFFFVLLGFRDRSRAFN